ncbi:hypothetical protein BHE74_00012806, partial [Ensete ventricosum]
SCSPSCPPIWAAIAPAQVAIALALALERLPLWALPLPAGSLPTGAAPVTGRPYKRHGRQAIIAAGDNPNRGRLPL